MNARFSILVASCFVALLALALLLPNSNFNPPARAAGLAKPTPTIDKKINAARVGNVQVAITPDANKLLPLNANAQLPANVIPNAFWKKGGNNGTNPTNDFIGTADDVALEFRVNNQRALRIVPNDTSPNLIGGSPANFVNNDVAGGTIGGGGFTGSPGCCPNRVTGSFGTVSGGDGNIASGEDATVAGGSNNTASHLGAAVGGGAVNIASGLHSTVAGGTNNTASDFGATVGGGSLNITNGDRATVAGGSSNVAGGSFAIVAGGRGNTAAGDYSFAAGRRAKIDSAADGTFMFADNHDFDFNTSKANQFAVRATGGVKFVAAINGSGDPTWTCSFKNGESWTCASDRNLKENFETVDGRALLEKLGTVPILKWNGKGTDPNIKHLGPMAQDFYAAFGLGDDDKSISTIDLDGVSLASIQALYQMLKDKDAQLAAQQREIHALRAELDALETRLQALETK